MPHYESVILGASCSHSPLPVWITIRLVVHGGFREVIVKTKQDGNARQLGYHFQGSMAELLVCCIRITCWTAWILLSETFLFSREMSKYSVA